MSLIHCSVCAHQVSVSAKQCVGCGHPLKGTGSSNRLLGMGLAALMTLTVGVGVYRIAPAATENFVARDFICLRPLTCSEYTVGFLGKHPHSDQPIEQPRPTQGAHGLLNACESADAVQAQSDGDATSGRLSEQASASHL